MKSLVEFINTIKYLNDNLDKIEDELLRKDIEVITKELRVIQFVPINEYLNFFIVS